MISAFVSPAPTSRPPGSLGSSESPSVTRGSNLSALSFSALALAVSSSAFSVAVASSWRSTGTSEIWAVVRVAWACASRLRSAVALSGVAFSASFSFSCALSIAVCARSSAVCMLASTRRPALPDSASVAASAPSTATSASSMAVSASVAAAFSALAGCAASAVWTFLRSSLASLISARACIRCSAVLPDLSAPCASASEDRRSASVLSNSAALALASAALALAASRSACWTVPRPPPPQAASVRMPPQAIRSGMSDSRDIIRTPPVSTELGVKEARLWRMGMTRHDYPLRGGGGASEKFRLARARRNFSDRVAGSRARATIS